jgi:DNA polymerase (family 10)
MDVEMAAVIDQAAKTNTALELNCSWQRLDLHDRHLRMARDAGVKISIDTDAHAPIQMEQMRYGVLTARRGWLRPDDVINTQPLFMLRKWIAKKRR